MKRNERARSGRGRGVACEGARVETVSCGDGRGAGGARLRHGQPSLSQGSSGRLRGALRCWQASAAAHAFAEEGETGEGRAVGARQPRMGRQRTTQTRPPPQSAGVQQRHAAVGSQGRKNFAVVNTPSLPGPWACPASPGRKVDLRCGRCHAGRTLKKERATCVDAEISIVDAKSAENNQAAPGPGGPCFGGGANLLECLAEMLRFAASQ